MAGDVGRAAGLKRTAPFNRFGQKSEVELAVLLGLAGERGGGLSTVMGSSGKGLPGLEIVSIGVRRTPPDVVQMDERTPVRQGLSESPQGRIRTGHSAASASVRCGGLLHPEKHGGPHAAASTKLRAADLVLSHGARAIEIEDVEARVAALEQAAEVSKLDSGLRGP